MTPTPVALVTGASGGIGEALARRLAAEGEAVVLVARSADRLAAVADAIRAAGGSVALVMALDLAERGAADRLAHRLRDAGLGVRHLVNNAGYGLSGDVVDLPRDGQLGILDLNCRALLDLTLAVLPDIVAARGGILNVASVAAFAPGPGLAVYYASKAFVLSLSRAMAAELAASGVTVTALCPGPTPTGFGARAGFDHAATSIALTRPLDADAVARIGLAGYRARRRVVVPGLVNRLLAALLPRLPAGLVAAAVGRIQRRRRGSVGVQPIS